MRLYTSFSNTFEITGNNETGQKLVEEFSLLLLCRGIILTILR